MKMEEFKTDIPERFYSDAEGKPFEYCQVCGKYLLSEGTAYVVEKALKNYKGYEFSSTIYEFAVCIDCHKKVQEGMSEESLANLQRYYQSIMMEKGQQPIMIDVNNFNIDQWLSKCFFKGDEIKELSEYQIVAQFSGDKMILNMPPMVIGEKAMEEMSELLSDKTIDEMNGFREKFLGPSPEIEELIYGKKLILM
jgi:cytochrome c553